ncbi:MAG: hypothetical protein TECD_01172 [Hyphomicrobiaceae bacterium hypho_1]
MVVTQKIKNTVDGIVADDQIISELIISRRFCL